MFSVNLGLGFLGPLSQVSTLRCLVHQLLNLRSFCRPLRCLVGPFFNF